MNIKRFDTYRGVVVDKNGTKGCRFVGNKIYGLPMGNEVFSLEGAHLSKLSIC